MSDNALKKIFLNVFHRVNGAKFVPFAGYEMPINYKKGIINEHLHVREKAGIFDVSHMGQILIPANDKNISSLENYIPLNIKKFYLTSVITLLFLIKKEELLMISCFQKLILITKKIFILFIMHLEKKF